MLFKQLILLLSLVLGSLCFTAAHAYPLPCDSSKFFTLYSGKSVRACDYFNQSHPKPWPNPKFGPKFQQAVEATWPNLSFDQKAFATNCLQYKQYDPVSASYLSHIVFAYSNTLSDQYQRQTIFLNKCQHFLRSTFIVAPSSNHDNATTISCFGDGEREKKRLISYASSNVFAARKNVDGLARSISYNQYDYGYKNYALSYLSDAMEGQIYKLFAGWSRTNECFSARESLRELYYFGWPDIKSTIESADASSDPYSLWRLGYSLEQLGQDILLY